MNIRIHFQAWYQMLIQMNLLQISIDDIVRLVWLMAASNRVWYQFGSIILWKKLQLFCSKALTYIRILKLFLNRLLRPRQNDRHFVDDIFISSLKITALTIKSHWTLFTKLGLITDNKPALVQRMAWHQINNKPLSQPTVLYFTTTYQWYPANRALPAMLTHGR